MLDDPEACTALFDDIGPSLTYFLQRRVADAHDLEDVFQEVFMAVFLGLSHLRTGTAV
jgi:DNA-directed RNA polymerase specialized sigma24 family protein